MRRYVLMAGAVVVVLTGCSSTPDPGPLFNDENRQPIQCMVHQTDEPGARYTAREMRNSGEILTLMRYYTAHGTKPYCDGAPAAETDRAWGRIYLGLGGAPERVSTVLR